MASLESKKSKASAEGQPLSRWAMAALIIFIVSLMAYSNWELHQASALHREIQHDAMLRYEKPLQGALESFSSSRLIKNIRSHSWGKAPARKKVTLPEQKSYKINQCYAYPNLDFWGTAVVYGNTNKKTTVGACCDSLMAYRGDDNPDAIVPNVWIWCGNKTLCGDAYQQCWLKFLDNIMVAKPTKAGQSVGWTVGSSKSIDLRDSFSGYQNKNENATWEQALDNLEAWRQLKGFKPPEVPRMFHIVTSSQGSGVEWSMRIHYYHFRKIRAQCRAQWGGSCEMGGFTRLLHSGSPDGLINEVPTIVVDPLPEYVIAHTMYVVLNRPYGFARWVSIAKIPERYLFMSEPDHIFMRPLPNLMHGDTPAAFPFFYIVPTEAKSIPIVKRHTGITTMRQLYEIAPIGSSPVFMTMDDAKKIMSVWSNTSIDVYRDPAAQAPDAGWGWVQEMYGFAMAAWKIGLRNITLIPELISQPPFDPSYEERFGHPFYILHYTYPMRFNNSGEMVTRDEEKSDWTFDKRKLGGVLPRNVAQPPPGVNNPMVRAMIRYFNEATDAIPCWDDYVSTKGKISQDCTEPPKGWFSEETDADVDTFW